MYLVVFQLLLTRSVIRFFSVSLASIIDISSLFIVLLFLLLQIAQVGNLAGWLWGWRSSFGFSRGSFRGRVGWGRFLPFGDRDGR